MTSTEIARLNPKSPQGRLGEVATVDTPTIGAPPPVTRPDEEVTGCV
jgi:hypothetical protein